ncbi:MAG TPA: FecR domain-containing protein, partial [Burkholderiales bacterium]|nr:FecR domain-containing protein [Burkholderiales bacterium]
MKLHSVGTSLITLSLLLVATVAEAAAPSVGNVSRIAGDQSASAQAQGTAERKLAAGDPVYTAERIRTGVSTVLVIEFTDKSRFTLGPNTEFEVEQYRQGAGNEAFHSRVFKGAFRFVSGLIARGKDSMRVHAPVVTVGVRGTHVEAEVNERQQKDGKTVDASAKVVLLEPEGPNKNTAIVAENKFGSVVIDKPGYGTVIPDEKS